MRTKNAIFGLFNIRPYELDKFIRLLAHAFLNGLGLALSFTAINVLVIEGHGVVALPYMYVGASVLLLFGGLIYSRLEHHISPPRLFAMALIISALWAFVMRFTITFQDSIVALSIAFCSYYLIYLLSNLEFWGSAALLFDVRQGKRIFGPLTTGESVAKILGYALTPVVAKFTCMQDALLISAFCFTLSYFLLKQLVNKYPHAFSHGHNGNHHGKHHKPRSFSDLQLFEAFGTLKKDKFLRYLSVFALLSTMVYFIIHYGFLDQIKVQFKKMEEIALFFGTFFTIAKALNYFIKLFLTGSLLSYVGIKRVLTILPIILLCINLVGIIGLFNHAIGAEYFIWIMGLNMAVDVGLRTSLYTPSYLIMFQPLTKAKRLEGHTVSKGIMEPIGIGLAGASILLFKYFGYYYIESYILLILIISAVWLFFAYVVGNEYICLLKRALKAKIFKQGTFELSKEERQDLREKRLLSEDPLEIIYATQLLQDELTDPEKEAVIRSLLDSDSPQFLSEALDFASQYHVKQLADKIKPLIEHPELSEKAVLCYTALLEEECVDELLQDRQAWNNEMKTAIIGGVLKHSGLYGAISLGEEFLDLLKSNSTSDRVNAARIIGMVNNPDYYHPLMILLKDDSLVVKQEAIKSAGLIRNSKLIRPVLSLISDSRLFSHIKRAVFSFGKPALKAIEELTQDANSRLLRKAIQLMAPFEDEMATEFLIAQVEHKSFIIRKESIQGLAHGYRLLDREMLKVVEQALDESYETIRMLTDVYLFVQKETLLEKALKNEIIALQLPLILDLLSLKYDQEIMARVKDNTAIREGDFRSNALELLENHLGSKDQLKFVPLFEKIFLKIDAKVEKHTTAIPLLESISEILSIEPNLCSNWLKAVAIRTLKEQDLRIEDALLERHDLSGGILKEEYDYYQKNK